MNAKHICAVVLPVTLMTCSIQECAAATSSVRNADFALRISDNAAGLRDNTQHAPVFDVGKHLSKWIAYTNTTAGSPRPVLSADNDDTGYHLDKNLLADVLGESLGGVSDCLMRKGEDSVAVCLKTAVRKNLEEWAGRGEKRLDVLGGWLALERTEGPADGRPAAVEDVVDPGRTAGDARADEEEDDDGDGGLIAALDRLTRRYALRVQVFPDVGVRMARSSTEDAVDYSVESLHEDFGTGREYGGGHKKKKKGGKKSAKKELEQLRKKMLLMMVPMAVQAVLLPLALLNMKLMLLKALLAGKLAIALILFNAARSGVFSGGGGGDALQQQVAAEHYGYGGGVEYPAMFERRRTSYSSAAAAAPGGRL